MEKGFSSSSLDHEQTDSNFYSTDIVDPARQRFPHSIVWTPIPCLSWLCPLIGHMGITTSSGIIRDFAGPYFVSEDNMAFGKPVKYWQIDIEKEGIAPEQWDKAINESCEEYKNRMHILCWDNCHSHCSYALSSMKLRQRNWNAFDTWFFMSLNSKYISCAKALYTYLPFLILFGIILFFVLFFSFN